jgi:hypothetical protein
MYFLSKKKIIEEFSLFAESFMVYLFSALNQFYQLEHDTALFKVNQDPEQFIIEYVMVVLGLMTLKKFSDFFKKSLSPTNQEALDSDIYDDDPERLKKYIEIVPNELSDALEEDYFDLGIEDNDGEMITRARNESDAILGRFYSEHNNETDPIGKSVTSDRRMAETVLENKEAMIEEVETWNTLFNRLNSTCLAMKFFIFTDHEDEEKGTKMNIIWKIFFENMKMINQLAKNGMLNPAEIPEDQERLFEMHKEFFMFLVHDLSPKMNEDTEFDQMRDYLQYHFENIYSDVDFYHYLSDMIISQNNFIQEKTPEKNESEFDQAKLEKIEDKSKGTKTISESLTKDLREDRIFSKETNSTNQGKGFMKQGSNSKLEDSKQNQFDFSKNDKPKKIRSVENTEDVFASVKGKGRIKQNKSKSNMNNVDFNNFDEYNIQNDNKKKNEINDEFFISNTVKEKQINRFKEVQSDVFDSEQFFSETDHNKSKPDHKKHEKKKTTSHLRVVDEEQKSETEESNNEKFAIKKPEMKATTFGELVNLDHESEGRYCSLGENLYPE